MFDVRPVRKLFESKSMPIYPFKKIPYKEIFISQREGEFTNQRRIFCFLVDDWITHHIYYLDLKNYVTL